MKINSNHQWPAGTELEKKIWVDTSIKLTCFLDELAIKYNKTSKCWSFIE
jgi:hypothetical protein